VPKYPSVIMRRIRIGDRSP